MGLFGIENAHINTYIIYIYIYTLRNIHSIIGNMEYAYIYVYIYISMKPSGPPWREISTRSIIHEWGSA